MSDHRARRTDDATASGFDLLKREIAARWSLLSSADSPWRDPGLYGHPLDSDDHWILAGRWDTYSEKPARARIHPLLGWTQGPILPHAPLGLIEETTRRLVRDGRPKVLFYGDSYVSGDSEQENWLPQQMDARFTGVDVLHLGVGGYGTGQMHLLFRETIGLVDRPRVVLMGVMPFSFDRAVLRVRSYQKPTFRVDGRGQLGITNVPIEPDPRRYYRRARLGFRSYVRRAARHVQARTTAWTFDEKARVNEAIIEANCRLAASVGAQLAYVVLHDHGELTEPDERTTFFHEALAERGVPTFDTAKAVLDHAAARGTDGAELYANGHHNDEGNQVIGRALGDWLEQFGL
ncbi:MAG: SGNH/GDSL hydrolase family protein [Planctomycetota bacterium]